MSMDVESRRAIVEYRIERAYKTLEEAEEVAKQDGTTYTGIFYLLIWRNIKQSWPSFLNKK